MKRDELLQTLRQMEEELHRAVTQRDPAPLEALLHPDFEEFGRSGKRYDKAEILRGLSTGGELPRGELAQLVERDNGIVEVRGSIPLLSTTHGAGRASRDRPRVR